MNDFRTAVARVGGLTLYVGAGATTAVLSGQGVLCLALWVVVLPVAALLVLRRREPVARAAPLVVAPTPRPPEFDLAPESTGVQRVPLERRARGVAHDLNNFLAVMRSSIEVLEERLPVADPLRAEVVTLSDTVTRASMLARKLVDAEPEPAGAKPFELLSATRALEPLLARMLPPGVRLHVQGDMRAWVVAEQTQVEQLLVNLVANARDAVGAKGEIWIDLASKWLDKSQLPAEGRLAPGCYAVLRVRDTGAGIPEEILPRIFDPFFTTKPVGAGTGLGLAASRDLICASGGDVMVASRPGHGTCFKVLLPEQGVPAPHQSLPTVTQRLRTRAGPGTPAGGIKVWASEPSSGTFEHDRCVLVVDDQPALLRSTSRTLKRAGHSVLTASDAEIALELVRDNPSRIFALVTDVHLPGRSGLELADELREKCRELAVVFVTGTSEQSELGDAVTHAVVVKKPFRSEELVSALETARSLVPRVA